jgi:hypothetical protein
VSRRRLGEAGAGGEMTAEEVDFALADGERHEACASRRTQGADRGVSSSCGAKRRGAASGGVRSEERAGDFVRETERAGLAPDRGHRCSSQTL